MAGAIGEPEQATAGAMVRFPKGKERASYHIN